LLCLLKSEGKKFILLLHLVKQFLVLSHD
jgi:hypothetical protein